MKKKLTNNIGLKILAVVASTLLWLVVVNIDDPVNTRNFSSIPVEVINGDTITKEGKVYEILDGSDTISVMVTAKRSILDELSRDNIKATADMMDMTFMDTVAIDVKSNRYSDKIESITPKTKNLKVQIEDLARKQFSIEVDTTGTPEQGYTLGDVETNVNVVSVSGPVSIISRIVRVAAEVDASGLRRDISTDEALVMFDASGDVVESDMITSSVQSVHVDIAMLQTKDIPLLFNATGMTTSDYGMTGVVDASPATVTIAGRGSSFTGMESISIPAEDLPVAGATADVEETINIRKYLPKDVALANPEFDGNVAVTVYVAPLQIKEINIPTDNITFSNIPEGYEAVLTDIGGVLAMNVKGLGDTFAVLDGSTTLGVIDVSAVLPEISEEQTYTGFYTGQVTCVFPTGISMAEPKSMHFILRQIGENITQEDFTEGEENNE